ncbi:hypothetical protein ABHI18_002598 [Aspergillus niger]
MSTQLAYDGSLPGLRKSEAASYYAARASFGRPLSQETIMEESDHGGDDDDNDDDLSYLDDSPFTSVASFGTGSISSASTPDEATTPDSTGLTAFDFHIDEKAVRGPNGPHLFRPSADLSDYYSNYGETEMGWESRPPSAMAPFHQSASKLDPIRRDTPVPNRATSTPQPQLQPQPLFQSPAPTQSSVQSRERHRPQQLQLHNQPRSIASQSTVSTEVEIRQWSPDDVVKWLHARGFDTGVVETFYMNDISGSILLELQNEDLKELGVQSFGKRHNIMNAIKSLRDPPRSASVGTFKSSEYASIPPTPRTHTSGSTSDCQSGSGSDSYKSAGFSENRRRRQHGGSAQHKPEDLNTGNPVSIVAIEQVLPKLHSCSKGESCRKWQKQQEKLSKLSQDLPIGNVNGRIVLTGDPGNPKTAPNLIKSPKSEVTPSLIASSDVMGPLRTPGLASLCKEKLNEVQPRDPQENVRNFLSFQHLRKIQAVNDPVTPPKELLETEEPCTSPRANPTLSENLRHLPKLMIPGTQDQLDDYTPELSSQRTVTQEYPTAIHRGYDSYGYDTSESPADFYRSDPHYAQGTPYSETDVPLTAIPAGLVPREDSQSVPPNMRFGSDRLVLADPIHRSASAQPGTHRRNTSSDERPTLRPIETPEEYSRTPRMGYNSPTRRSPNDVTHSGWMKKRKTTRLLRHEWEENLYTLKGTQLAKHSNEAPTQRHSKALEYIDVDDYAVACSSLASSSKLTAAFKKTVLKRRNNTQNDSAFSFSLIPATGAGNSQVDKKALFLHTGKSHHFAVKTRDERIDWMRELMLAKALKRGREGSVDPSNNFI